MFVHQEHSRERYIAENTNVEEYMNKKLPDDSTIIEPKIINHGTVDISLKKDVSVHDLLENRISDLMPRYVKIPSTYWISPDNFYFGIMWDAPMYRSEEDYTFLIRADRIEVFDGDYTYIDINALCYLIAKELGHLDDNTILLNEGIEELVVSELSLCQNKIYITIE